MAKMLGFYGFDVSALHVFNSFNFQLDLFHGTFGCCWHLKIQRVFLFGIGNVHWQLWPLKKDQKVLTSRDALLINMDCRIWCMRLFQEWFPNLKDSATPIGSLYCQLVYEINVTFKVEDVFYCRHGLPLFESCSPSLQNHHEVGEFVAIFEFHVGWGSPMGGSGWFKRRIILVFSMEDMETCGLEHLEISDWFVVVTSKIL